MEAMNALILITCALSGGDCRPHLQADMLFQTACMVQSQQIAAEYVKEHPNRKVQRVICTDRRRIAYYLGKDQA